MIQVLVDYRERGLLECLAKNHDPEKNKGIQIVSSNLELGDVHIVIYDKADTVQRTLVYERKSLPDMISSITDGRYREQKVRMLATYESRNIAYIIEGDSIGRSFDRDNSSVCSSYFNMVYRDNIHLFFTEQVNETSLFILTLCQKIIAVPKNYLVQKDPAKSTSITEYTSHVKIKSKKSQNITPENCFLLQISQIPTISHVVAKKIANVFPTMQNLIAKLMAQPSQRDRIALLSSIDMVGPEKASKILKYMQLL